MAKKRTARQRSNQNALKNTRQNGDVKISNESPAKSCVDVKQNGLKADNTPSKTTGLALCPPKGLVNLGNTCFFNSVMQNLCRTSGLLYLLKEASTEKQLVVSGDDVETIRCELGPLGKLTQALVNFLTTMNEDTSSLTSGSNNQKQNKRSKTESPKILFNQICNVSPRFRGYQQQDSQELLQALLDGVKSEEIKRRKQAILSNLKIDGKKAKDVNLELRGRVKLYGQAVTKMPTVIDQIFGGQIVSSVLCDECGKITQVFENFLDIPLPIVEGVQAHHICDSKKHKKEEEIDYSTDKSKSVNNNTLLSKHQTKKNKKQGRKNNRRHRTKSQTIENGENNTEASTANSGIISLTTEIKSLEIEPLKGTDFSTNKVAKMNHKTVFNESNVELQNEQEIKEKSQNIVELAIESALNKMSKISYETSTGTVNGGCKGGFNSDKPIDSYENNHDTDDKSEARPDHEPDVVQCRANGESNNSSNLNEINKSSGDAHNSNASNNLDGSGSMNGITSAKCSDSEPSSGNDENEESVDDMTKTNPQDEASLFDTPLKKSEVKFTDFCAKLPTSLSPRYEPKNQECSIQSCLHKFTMAEMLTGQNKYGCEECTKRQTKGQQKPKTVYCNASKQMLIKVPPLILTLQLKRFQQTGRSLRKLGKRVDIPVEFDISPFCTADENSKQSDKKEQMLYRIYGIVEHCGSLSRGHYTSYVNVRSECTDILKRLEKNVTETDDSESFDQWFHISDTAVSKTTLDRALNSNAYLVFYERVF